MPTVEVTEYAAIAQDKFSEGAQCPDWGSVIGTQKKAFTTAATLDAAFSADTRFVRIVMTGGDGYVEYGTPPAAADATSERFIENVTEYRGVEPGANISVYDGTS